MDMLIVIGVMVGLAILPFVLLAGMASLALLIWSWKRIGPHCVNFGRWVGDWRNFTPLSILGILAAMTLVVFLYILPQLRTFWIILLVVHGIVTIACLTFAIIAWTLWFHRWFWPRYRSFFWRGLAWFIKEPQSRRARTRSRSYTPPVNRMRRQDSSGARSWPGEFWALMIGKRSTQGTRTSQAGATQTGPPADSPGSAEADSATTGGAPASESAGALDTGETQKAAKPGLLRAIREAAAGGVTATRRGIGRIVEWIRDLLGLD